MNFKQFFGHDETFIRDTAVLLENATEAMQQGALSKKEYAEITQDLTELDEAHAVRLSVERRAAVEKALHTMKVIAQEIMKFM